MHPTLCSRCKKNVAVIFVTKLEAGKTTSEGYCLKCARELDLKPVDDIMKRMGLSDDDLEGLTNEMMNAMDGMEGLLGQNQDDDQNEDDDEDMSRTATFPFLNKLFGGMQQGGYNLPANPPRRSMTGRSMRKGIGRRSRSASSWTPTA